MAGGLIGNDDVFLFLEVSGDILKQMSNLILEKTSRGTFMASENLKLFLKLMIISTKLKNANYNSVCMIFLKYKV